MYLSSIQYIRCVKCSGVLYPWIFEKENDEIIEGVLICRHCKRSYPIISSIPFLVDDLSSYFSIRSELGGYLMLHSKSILIKSMIKESLKKIRQVRDDTTSLEKNWVGIYKRSKQHSFIGKMKSTVNRLPKCDLVLEHGCSIGTMSEILAKKHGTVLGIDKSFFALVEAKGRKIKNADFFLADSLSAVFGTKFDLVVALNVLELIEPDNLLQTICNQTRRYVVLSDPYDYERGKHSVRTMLDEKTLREKLEKFYLRLVLGTDRPSHVSWNLKVNPRLELRYKVDLVVADMSHKKRLA